MDYKSRMPGLTGDMERDLRSVLDYAVQGFQETRYYLNNLDLSNFNDTDWATYEGGRLEIVADLIDIKTKGITVDIDDELNGLSTRIDANAKGLTVVSESVTDLGATLRGEIETSASGIRAEFTKSDTALGDRIDGISGDVGNLETTLRGEITASAAGLTATFDKQIKEVGEQIQGVDVELRGEIKASAETLTTAYSKADKDLDGKITQANSKISQNATQIQTIVETTIPGLDGKVDSFQSSITQNANQIQTIVGTTIPGLEGQVGALDTKVEGFQSSITQNANQIQTIVQTTIPGVQQDLGKLDTKVNGFQSSITQNADKIALVVSDSNKINAASIVTAINGQTGASKVTIKANQIDLEGVTTFVKPGDLGEFGTTEIDGGRIKSGTIEGVTVKSVGTDPDTGDDLTVTMSDGRVDFGLSSSASLSLFPKDNDGNTGLRVNGDDVIWLDTLYRGGYTAIGNKREKLWFKFDCGAGFIYLMNGSTPIEKARFDPV